MTVPDGPISRACAIAADDAPAADRRGRLSPATVAAVTEAGFARYFVPKRRGGDEGTFGDLVAAVAQVAQGCTSAAWCAALWAAHSRFAALLPEEGQDEIWRASPDVRISAAVVPPAGTAVETPTGWRLTGEWTYASGVDFADWVLLAAPPPEQGSQGPDGVRVFAVPRADIGVVDSWDDTGMRGTGSNTVIADEVAVPRRRSVDFAAILRGDATADRARCHSVPAQLAGGLMFAAPALGCARRALREWARWATEAHGSRPPQTVASPAVRDALARSSAELAAAELLLAGVAHRSDDGPTDAAAVARNQRDAAFAVETLVHAVERLYRTGGSAARSGNGALSRCWRDVHTLAGHAVLRMETAADAYAAALTPIPASASE